MLHDELAGMIDGMEKSAVSFETSSDVGLKHFHNYEKAKLDHTEAGEALKRAISSGDGILDARLRHLQTAANHRSTLEKHHRFMNRNSSWRTGFYDRAEKAQWKKGKRVAVGLGALAATAAVGNAVMKHQKKKKEEKEASQ